MFRHLRVHQVFGANTEVGKTLFATALCRASVAAGEASHYLKPVGTGGYGDDSHIKTYSPKTDVTCLYRFDEPVSPHLAAQRTSKKDATYRPPTDKQFVKALGDHLNLVAKKTASGTSRASLIVETAGGVHSPTLSGTTQVDAYRPLRLPTILVASPHLGGISTTLSSYESLLLRGYDVDAILCLKEGYYENWKYFSDWCRDRGIPFATMRQPPAQHENREKDAQIMWKYYDSPPLQRTNRSLSLVDLIESLQDTHNRRLNDLDKAPAEARSSYWYPFVQHKHIKQDTDIMVIDSAYKDCFTVQTNSEKTGRNLQDVFDGSASWWTQCLGHGNADLALAAAYAAGRYGHVIFPTATHEPAQKLTRTLLNTVGQYWADRVFFSDDGSTAMEVALKMALKHTSTKIKDNGRREPLELSVLGLKGSYHGDTIGVMDASEPSVYNKSVEWYRGRGFWLDVPTVQMKDGQVKIQFPTKEWGVEEPEWTPFTFNFNTLSDVYDIEARLELQDRLYGYYYNVIHKLVQAAQKEHNLYFGALVMEPLVIGAGGMHFVDPFFQKALIDFARDAFEESLPVIFDEVFVGLYRLGVQSSTSVLGCTPDIACYAKILTGGLLPMSVTLATNEVFSSFLGDKKQDALLHGHSYTAQPVGCAVANKTMDLLQSHDARNPEWLAAKSVWAPPQYECLPIRIRKPTFFTLWDREFINKVSYLPNVESVMTMGTVLKISLVDQENAGYQSTASADFLKKLREPTDNHLPVHARPLGNTVYWMSSVNTPRSTLEQVEAAILAALV